MSLTVRDTDALIEIMHSEGSAAAQAKAEGRADDQIAHHLKADKIYRVVAAAQWHPVKFTPSEHAEVAALVS